MQDDLPSWLTETQSNSSPSTASGSGFVGAGGSYSDQQRGGGINFAALRSAQAGNIHSGIGNANLLSLVQNQTTNTDSATASTNTTSNVAVPAGWNSSNTTGAAAGSSSSSSSTAALLCNSALLNEIPYTFSRQPPPGPTHFGLVDPPRRALYRMIIKQLLSDGHSDAAMAVAQSTGVLLSNPGNNPQQLLELVNSGITANRLMNSSSHSTTAPPGSSATKSVESYIEDVIYGCDPYSAYDLPAQNAFDFREWYTSRSFDRPVRCIDFHQTTGKTVAVGTSNGDVRIYSTQLADEFARSASVSELQTPTDIAMIRSLPGLHPGHSVECVGLHPHEPLCVSGGRDGRLVFTKYGQVTTTRNNNTSASSNIGAASGRRHHHSTNNNQNQNQQVMSKVMATHHDSYAVRCMAFHPSGEVALFGTDHNAPRLYHLETGSIFSPSFVSQSVGNTVTGPQNSANNRGIKNQPESDPNIVHIGSITDVSYSVDGRHFASSSFDGSIRIFDGRQGSEVVGIHKAHCGVAVTSVELSKSGYMILTAGLDSQVRIWDIRKPAGGTEIAAFSTTGNAPKKLSFHARSRACFSHDEHSIIATNSTFQGLMYVDAATMRVTSTIDYWNPESSAKNPGDKDSASASASSGIGSAASNAVEREAAAREEFKNGVGSLTSGVIRAVASCPNRCLLAAGGDDMRLRLWAPVLTTMK